MMIHFLLVDMNNSGDLYRVGVETEKDLNDVLSYFYNYSNDVRYLTSHESAKCSPKKKKGQRVTPCGTIISCKPFGSKIGYHQRFTGKRLEIINSAEIDRRHTLG